MSNDIDDHPPEGPALTGYDEAHLVHYLRLLDADAEGAPWQEAVALIFGVDPADDPARWQAVHDRHLARARWMTEAGYRQLLKPPPP